MPTTTAAKPGRKPNSRANLDALLKASEPCVEACARAAKEKRPVEFVTQPRMVSLFDPQQASLEPRVLWAWPDGTVTSPMTLRQRTRDQLNGRARHGETLPLTAYEIVERMKSAKHVNGLALIKAAIGKDCTPTTGLTVAKLLAVRNLPPSP